MQLVVILVGGLVLSILFQLYSARRRVMHMESGFNLNKACIDFDHVDPAATSISTVRHSHCAIVVSRLYGNHTERRRKLTLDWYRNLTVNSIRLAAERSNMAAVMIVLKNTESYANEVVDDTDTFGSVVFFFQNEASGSMETTDSKVQRMASERQCQFISIMRLDADDLLLPAAFQNIEVGWTDVMSSNNCTSSLLDHHCPHALVSGIPHSQMVQIVLDPIASDGTMTCAVLGKLDVGQPRKFQPSSAGLAVTITYEVWMSRFVGESGIVGEIQFRRDHHKPVPNMVAEMMQNINVSTHSQILSSNHSVWIQTPLSGHYLAQHGHQRNCTLPFLTLLFGEEGGDMLWTNRRFIPRLTREEWESNHWIGVLNSGNVRRRKRLNAERLEHEFQLAHE